MLKELQEKKALLKKEADASKLERNRLNAEASQFATRRDELNTKTRALIDSAQQSKDKRDEYNKLVSENKDKRDGLNEQANTSAKVISLNLGSRLKLEVRKKSANLWITSPTSGKSTERSG